MGQHEDGEDIYIGGAPCAMKGKEKGVSAGRRPVCDLSGISAACCRQRKASAMGAMTGLFQVCGLRSVPHICALLSFLTATLQPQGLHTSPGEPASTLAICWHHTHFSKSYSLQCVISLLGNLQWPSTSCRTVRTPQSHPRTGMNVTPLPASRKISSRFLGLISGHHMGSVFPSF